VLVRKDISLPQQAVQSIHAAIEAARCGLIPPDIPHPHIVLCSVSDEISLKEHIHRLDEYGIKYKSFFEPDRNNELTAIATEPILGSRRKIFNKIPLFSIGV